MNEWRNITFLLLTFVSLPSSAFYYHVTHLCARVDPLLRSVWPRPPHHLRWIYMANLWDEFRVKNGHHWMYLLFMSPCVTLCNEDIVQSGENLCDIKFPNSKYIYIYRLRYTEYKCMTQPIHPRHPAQLPLCHLRQKQMSQQTSKIGPKFYREWLRDLEASGDSSDDDLGSNLLS